MVLSGGGCLDVHVARGLQAILNKEYEKCKQRPPKEQKWWESYKNFTCQQKITNVKINAVSLMMECATSFNTSWNCRWFQLHLKAGKTSRGKRRQSLDLLRSGDTPVQDFFNCSGDQVSTTEQNNGNYSDFQDSITLMRQLNLPETNKLLILGWSRHFHHAGPTETGMIHLYRGSDLGPYTQRSA